MVTASSAQYTSGQFGLEVHTSGIKLVGGNTDDSMVNYASGVTLKYSFSKFLTAELTAGLGWVRPRDPDSHFEARDNAPYRTYLYPWSLNLRYNFLPNWKFVPYIGIGAGLTHWNLRDVSEEDTWFPIPQSGSSITGTQTNFTVRGMLGWTLFITHKLGLDMGVCYAHLLDQDLDNIGTGDVNTGLIEVRLGLGLYFGGYRDSDGDGIEDKYDANPHQREDFDGFRDEDGAPDPDNDNDGIPDLTDEAPNLPEDIDGFQDEDGMPDPDNDNDGIPDAQDQCPDESEDFDGFQDEDGCPELDNDNDGIPDHVDECPNEPETLNDYQDDDGCPDVKPEIPIPEKGKPLVLTGVTFASGKAVLTGEAKGDLDKVYESLRGNTDVRVEIRGFTDSIGSAASNLNLSQRRADAVKDYLVKKNIAFERLRAIGYGEANPIASNNTREGRTKNRRIEFIRIED